MPLPPPNVLQSENSYQHRISVLEYDLRQERSNLQTLRLELQNLMAGVEQKELDIVTTPATPFEVNTLNYCVREYLMNAGYKLTAISFSQEASDSFDDWRNLAKIYGIRDYKPPALRLLYRYFIGGGVNKHEFGYKEVLEERIKEIDQLKYELEKTKLLLQQSQQSVKKLEMTNQILQMENETLNKKLQNQIPFLNQNLNLPSLNRAASVVSPHVTSPQYTGRVSNTGTVSVTTNTDSFTTPTHTDDPKNIEASPEVSVPDNPGTIANSSTSNGSPPIIEVIDQPTVVKTTDTGSEGGSLVASGTTTGGVAPVDKSTASTAMTILKHITSKNRDFNKLLIEDALDGVKHSHIARQVMSLKSIENSSQLVDILSQSIPRITKGVILQERQELLPMLLVAICWNPDEKSRLQLTHLLFNLIRQPNEAQRKVIMAGCIWLATLTDPDRTANELLPQCWEQIDSSLEERRILVAEAIGSLAPHVKPELRLSLLLSVLMQLTDDSVPQVREAVIKNVAKLLIVQRYCDDLMKYNQFEELIFKFLKDKSHEPRDATKRLLLPVFGDWCEQNNWFFTPFLANQIKKLSSIVEEFHASQSSVTATTAFNAKERFELVLRLNILRNFIPQLVESFLKSAPKYTSDLPPTLDLPDELEELDTVSEGDKIVLAGGVQPPGGNLKSETEGDASESETDNTLTDDGQEPSPAKLIGKTGGTNNKGGKPSATPPVEVVQEKEYSEMSISFVARFSSRERAILMKIFDISVTQQYHKIMAEAHHSTSLTQKESPELHWVITFFIPKMVGLATMIDVANTDVFLVLCSVISELSYKAGPPFARILKTIFENRLSTVMTQLQQEMDPNKCEMLSQTRISLLVVYLCGVLVHIDKKMVRDMLKEVIVHVSLDEDRWQATHSSVVSTAMTGLCNVSTFWIEEILELLWELMVHPANRVRALVTKFFGIMAREVLDENLIAARVLPAVITLSAGINRAVKLNTIGAFGDMAAVTTSPEVLDKVKVQMNSLLVDATQSSKMQREFVRVFAKIIPEVTPQFLQDFIVKELQKLTITASNSKQILVKKKRIFGLLLQAYKAVLGCDLPDEIKENSVLPSLEILRRDLQLFEIHDQKILTDLIADVRALLVKYQPNIKSSEPDPPDTKPPPPPKQEEPPTSAPTSFFGFFDRDKEKDKDKEREKEKEKDKDKDKEKPIVASSAVVITSKGSVEEGVQGASNVGPTVVQGQTSQEESTFLNITSRFASLWDGKKT